jgi:hypothetical protein
MLLNYISKSLQITIPRILITIFLFTVTSVIYAQEHDTEGKHETETKGHHESKKWRFSAGIGQSYLQAGSQIGTDTKVLIIPTIGLRFGYKLSPRFSPGLLTELEIVSYAIRSDDHDDIEREYPVLLILA